MKHQSGNASGLIPVTVDRPRKTTALVAFEENHGGRMYREDKLELDPSVSSTHRLNMELDESLFGLLRTAVLIG
jgi:hypothetical protein